MPQPVLNVSLEEVQRETVLLIESLESASAKHPSWSWPSPFLVLAREWQTLAAEQPLDAERIRDFKGRLRQHIVTQRLKGFDDLVWFSEALERLARRPDAA